MLKEYSPFTPGVPVPIALFDLFAGRKEEIEQLKRAVNQVLHGRQEMFF